MQKNRRKMKETFSKNPVYSIKEACSAPVTPDLIFIIISLQLDYNNLATSHNQAARSTQFQYKIMTTEVFLLCINKSASERSNYWEVSILVCLSLVKGSYSPHPLPLLQASTSRSSTFSHTKGKPTFPPNL